MILLISTVFIYKVARVGTRAGHPSRRSCWFGRPVPSLRAAGIGMYQDGAIAAPC
jgi:hypothetical protein